MATHAVIVEPAGTHPTGVGTAETLHQASCRPCGWRSAVLSLEHVTDDAADHVAGLDGMSQEEALRGVVARGF